MIYYVLGHRTTILRHRICRYEDEVLVMRHWTTGSRSLEHRMTNKCTYMHAFTWWICFHIPCLYARNYFLYWIYAWFALACNLIYHAWFPPTYFISYNLIICLDHPLYEVIVLKWCLSNQLILCTPIINKLYFGDFLSEHLFVHPFFYFSPPASNLLFRELGLEVVVVLWRHTR